MSQFQLFPTPSPQTKASKNPFRRDKKPAAPSNAIPLQDVKGNTPTEAVLVHVVEEANNIPPPPKAHIQRSQSISTAAPETPESRAWSSPREKADQWNSPATEVDSKSVFSTDSQRHATSHKTPPPPHFSNSPVIPMRSIFPRYDPNVPLNQQKYYPQLPNDSPRGPRPRALTLSPQAEIDRTLGPKTVPASIMNFPTDVLDPVEVRYSSADELKNLWEAANGQRPENLAAVYNLRVARTNSSTFTFGDPQAPFYTMHTNTPHELSIQRANPLTPKSDVPIMTLKLEDRQLRTDGLITQLFSRLAAMLAIDQAEELARHHLLSAHEAADVEASALKRAAAQESCKLAWSPTKRVYELRHPCLSKQTQQHQSQPQQPLALVGAAGIPLSPIRAQYAGLLHISVSSRSRDSTGSNMDAHRAPPTIIATAPLPSLANAIETGNGPATPRTSTLPLTDTDEQLASLDLATMTLSVSAAAIVATVPSLYAIDSLVSAMLAVAVSDQMSSLAMNEMPLYNPYENQTPLLAGGGGGGGSGRFTGKLVATLAEREDAEQGTQLTKQIKSSRARAFARVRTSTSTRRGGEGESIPSRASWFPSVTLWRSKNKDDETQVQQKKGQKVTIVEEIDLERYGRYGQSSSREGEKLPGVTRGVLRLLFWGLKMVVVGLTMVVKILAWVLVMATRCVTSEKL